MFSMSRVLMTETSDMKITTFLFLDELFDDPDYPVHNFEALPLITLQNIQIIGFSHSLTPV